MLTEFGPGKTQTKAVTIVISGSRPRASMEKQAKRLAGYDGRMSDLGKGASPHFMPWISDSWRSHFKWRGKGDLPAAEQAKLKRIVQQAHKDGQKSASGPHPTTPPLGPCCSRPVSTSSTPTDSRLYPNSCEPSKQSTYPVHPCF